MASPGLMQNVRHRFTGQKGFTTVELLVAMVLMLVVLAGVYTIWFGLQRTYSFTDDDMAAQQQARTALSEMVEAIRTARQPEPAPSQDLDFVIVSADANSLVCWTDVDRDPLHQVDLVRYWVNTATRTLYRDDFGTVAAPSSTAQTVRLVSNSVSNNAARPLFTYTQANGTVLPTPVADPTQIREVTIDLLIDIAVDRAPISHELRTVVQPRNLRQY